MVEGSMAIIDLLGDIYKIDCGNGSVVDPDLSTSSKNTLDFFCLGLLYDFIFAEYCNVADPGCLSRIPDPSFFHP
jgi:hypothetical protein